jgi:hypothetical protein
MPNPNKMKPKNKKPDIDSKIGKYFINRQKGINKRQAQLQAGFPDGQHAHRIENTKTYKAIEKVFYKDALLSKITIHELADEHLKNILQDNDLGAKNKAIQMALEKLEPDKVVSNTEDGLTVIFKGANKVREVQVEEPESDDLEFVTK